jgi:hypothetical protein
LLFDHRIDDRNEVVVVDILHDDVAILSSDRLYIVAVVDILDYCYCRDVDDNTVMADHRTVKEVEDAVVPVVVVVLLLDMHMLLPLNDDVDDNTGEVVIVILVFQTYKIVLRKLLWHSLLLLVLLFEISSARTINPSNRENKETQSKGPFYVCKEKALVFVVVVVDCCCDSLSNKTKKFLVE